MMNNHTPEIIKEQIYDAKRVLVVSHIRPDGDAIGSLLGLGLSISEIGKDVTMVSEDGVPACFKHLPGSELVVKRPEGEYDFIAVVDCSDINRVGTTLNGYSVPDLNIDHHVTNLYFGRTNLVDPSAVATTEMLTEYIPIWDLPITPSIAEVLLTGMITDTLGFRTSNMTSSAMRVAANLMDKGANLSELYNLALKNKTFEAMRLWGSGLNNLERNGALVWTTLTRADKLSAGYPGRDDADLINILSSIDGALISIIFVEQPNDSIKVSWRAQQGVDVSQIALQFGGGGHPAAAGAEIEGSLESVRNNVLQETNKLLEIHAPIQI